VYLEVSATRGGPLGAIWIGRRDRQAATETAVTVLVRQGFHGSERLQTPTHEVLVYPRQTSEAPAMVHRRPNGDWIAAAGSPLRGKLRDSDALADVFEEFDGTTQGLDVAGTFALVVYKAGRLHVTTDRLSAFPVFRGASGAVSTSWLALAMTEPGISFDDDAVYEYVLTGGLTGDETLAREIRRLPWCSTLTIGADGEQLAAPSPVLPDPDTRPRSVLLDETERLLFRYLDRVLAATDGRVGAGLSAGLDSRLLVASVRRHGSPPRLRVYGDGTLNVAVARELAAVIDVPLTVIGGETARPADPGTFAAIVEQNMYTSDGWAAEGLFHGYDLRAGRAARSAGDWCTLHGAGGEILRNFPMLNDRPKSAADFARAVYVKFGRAVTTDSFDRATFVAGIADKVSRLTRQPAGKKLPRQWIEWLYPHYRGRALMGRDNGLNAWVRMSLQPFYEADFMNFATRIPLKWKTGLAFVAELNRRADPAMAAVRSQYGFAYSSPPPAKVQAVQYAKANLPLGLRGALYALRARCREPASRNRYLTPPMVAAALPEGPERTGKLLRFRAMTNPEMLSRAYTVDFLARRLER
jgi:asparagine synthetase B (glutamine-hydrolysing)